MFCKAVSPIIMAMDSVRLCKLARPHVTCRHALKSIKEYLLGQQYTVYVTVSVQVAYLLLRLNEVREFYLSVMYMVND